MTDVSRIHFRFRFARCLAAALLVTVVGILASIMVGGPVRTAQAQTPTPTPRAWSDNRCLPSNSNCTANEGGVSDVYEGDISSRCEEAPIDFIVGTFFVEFGTPNTNRYDYGIFLSEGDPIVDDSSTMCYVEALHPTGGAEDPDNPAGTGPFRELEASNNNEDACGDISSSDGPPAAIFLTTAEASIPCVDNDNDGFIEIDWCFTYDNNRQDNCWDIDDIAPGTPAKCDCGTRNTTTIPIGAADLEITKETLSQDLVSVSGSNYTYDAVFEITVQNTGVRDLEDFTLTDDLDDWSPSGATINSASATLYDSDFTFGGTRGCTVVANGSYDGVSDTDLTVPASSCLGYDDINRDDTGDFVVFRISVNFTTTCAADYTNTAEVSTQPDTGIDNPTGGGRIIETATSNVGCTPTAVDLVDIQAGAEKPGRQGMVAILAALAVAGAALVLRRRDTVGSSR